nr:uncharacterized protein LOC128680891 [Plodia interpunctella]
MIFHIKLRLIFGATIISMISLLLVNESNCHMEELIDDVPRIDNLTCTCERVYVPVCATDNRTYINECYFNCLNKYRIVLDSEERKAMGTNPIDLNKYNMSIMWRGPCVSTRFDKVIDLEYIAHYDYHHFPWS